MKRLGIYLVLSMLLMSMFSCSSHYMKRGSGEQYIVPTLESLPTEFSLVFVKKNKRFAAATGIQGTISYPLLKYTKDGKETRLLVTDFSKLTPNAPSDWIGFIPEAKDKIIGDKLTVADRCGQMACNISGNCRYINGKPNAPENADLLYTIGSGPEVIAIKKGSAEFKNLETVFESAGIKVVFIKTDKASQVGSYLSQKTIEDVIERDSFWANEWKKMLGSGWKLLLAYPLVSPQTTGFFVLVTKVMEIPSFYTSNDVAGCVGFKPTAFDTAEIAENVMRGMPMMTQENFWDQKLPADFLYKLKGTSCENISTYNEYLKCVGEFNAGVEQRNAQRKGRK